MKLRELWLRLFASLAIFGACTPGGDAGDIASVRSALSAPHTDEIQGRLRTTSESRWSGAASGGPGWLKNGFRVDNKVLRDRILVVPPDPGLTIPHWTESFVSKGTKFPSVTVGTDPALGQTTTVPVTITPYRLVFSDGYVLDASSDLLDGVTPLQGVLDSPIFQPAPFSAGGTSLGVTQWGDAVLRANYWDRRPKNDGYHVLLGTPVVAPTVTVNVPQL